MEPPSRIRVDRKVMLSIRVSIHTRRGFVTGSKSHLPIPHRRTFSHHPTRRHPPSLRSPLVAPYPPARTSACWRIGSSHHWEGIVSDLMLHAGGRLVTLDELQACKTPPPEGRWHPVSHGKVLATVKETLHGAGYQIKAEKYALARSDARF